MKNKLIGFLLLVASIGLWFSCTKTEGHFTIPPGPPTPPSPPPPPPVIINLAPVANAGANIVIGEGTCASLHWTILDGSASYDPDDSIVLYGWSQISGPTVIVSNAGSKQAIVLDIRAERYSFQLLVRDTKGAVHRDTVEVDATGWSLHEYELDITVNGTFEFFDNYQDPIDNSYNDFFIINTTGDFSPFGEFACFGGETSDTSASANNWINEFTLSAAGYQNTFLHIPFIRGNCSVYFKQLMQNGGGSFSGTFRVFDGTASTCDRLIYQSLPLLTLTGYMDTTARTINLNIKGRIYF